MRSCLLLVYVFLLQGNHACPVGQYPSDPGPSTVPSSVICLQCPVHTTTGNQPDIAVSSHDCRCEPGYLCMYNRQVHATVSLNATLHDFENDVHGVRSAFLSGVASAAGVSSAQVHVHFVVIRLNHRRRRLHSSPRESIRVSLMVLGASNDNCLLNLHTHLSSMDMVADSWVVRRHVLVLGTERGRI